jgi:ribosomal protein L40E
VSLFRIIHKLHAKVDGFMEKIEEAARELEELGLKKDICPTCGHLRGLDGNCRWCGENDR